MLLGAQRLKRSQKAFRYISYAAEDRGIFKHVMRQVGQGYRMDWIGCLDNLLPPVHHMSFLMLKTFRQNKTRTYTEMQVKIMHLRRRTANLVIMKCQVIEIPHNFGKHSGVVFNI